MKTIECTDELIDSIEVFRNELKKELITDKNIEAVFIFDSYLPWSYQKFEEYQFELRSLINIVVCENIDTEYIYHKYHDFLRDYILKLGIYLDINIVTTKKLLMPVDQYDYSRYYLVNSNILFDKNDICQKVPPCMYYPQLTKDEPCILIRKQKYYR